MDHITCRECGRDKPADSGFYSKVLRGRRYHLQPCRQCQSRAAKKTRRNARVHGDYWYQEATGNKRPLPYSFSHRFGSRWLKFAAHYKRALRGLDEHLKQHRNAKARAVLRNHIQCIPSHLPYVLNIEGDEWPLIAHALIAVRETESGEYRRVCTNLYNLLVKLKTEAKYDHLHSGLSESE